MRIEARAGAPRRPPQQTGRDAPPSAACDTPRPVLQGRTDSARASQTARSSLGRNRSWSTPSRLTGRIEVGLGAAGAGHSPHREANALYVEAFPAAALIFHIRIVEFETFVQTLACEIELGPVKVQHALGVDDDGDAMAFELMILRADVVGVFELVREAGATRGAHAQAQTHAFPPFGQKPRDVAGRGLGERNRHRSIRQARQGRPAWSLFRPWAPRPNRASACNRRPPP